MTAMDEYRKSHKATCAAVEAALKANGLTLKKIRASVDPTSGVIRFSIETHLANQKGADGEATNPERERYKNEASLWGLSPEWLDKPMVMAGREYVISGMRARGKKIVLATCGGKTYVFDHEDVTLFMSRAPNAASALGR